ncbi:MAG: hypothetical protein CMB22_04615 [Euryarchaeota archaeon]|nr:hypothetical protein [Euryarchaeota archaeon]
MLSPLQWKAHYSFKVCHRVDGRLPLPVAMDNMVWIVQTTLPGDLNEAEVGMWCQSIIDSNLAACIDIKRTTSVFRWKGETQSVPEWDVQIRTPESKKGDLVSKIKSEHSYELPCITWWPVESTKEYYDWVQG